MDASRDIINNLLYETKVASINKLERTHDTIGEFFNTYLFHDGGRYHIETKRPPS